MDILYWKWYSDCVLWIFYIGNLYSDCVLWIFYIENGIVIVFCGYFILEMV